MRLKISKSKNTILFYIIKDYTRNGKRSTKIVKRIGNLEDIKTMAGDTDYKEWLKEYVRDFNEKQGRNPSFVVLKQKNRHLSQCL